MLPVSFSPLAKRSLNKLSPSVQRRVIEKLEFYARQENPLTFAEKLIDRKIGDYRFRIGDYRVIFDLKEKQILILLIGHRREIYR